MEWQIIYPLILFAGAKVDFGFQSLTSLGPNALHFIGNFPTAYRHIDDGADLAASLRAVRILSGILQLFAWQLGNALWRESLLRGYVFLY